MNEQRVVRTPFVLGKPIKNPADFYGRKPILRELFDAALNAELVAVVGEHRCGNTSIIYQMLHPDVRAEYLSDTDDAGLLFVLISSQLAAEGPGALFRRIARSLRRSDPEARADFGAEIGQVWMEDYLEDLADRHRRLVLLIDEFEVLADFEPGFWEWFEKLVTGYDVSMVVTARSDLGEFRSVKEGAPSFFNMFRSVYAGSFCEETVDIFLREKSEITDFDFLSVKDVIDELAGRFPYYIQVAAALFYLHAGGASKVTPDTLDTIRTEFRTRTEALFDDAWHKLPHVEREALAWLLLGARPEGADEQLFSQALQSLERRAYVVDGRIFSSAFAGFTREQIRRVSLNSETGRVRVGTGVQELDARSVALLEHLMFNEGLLINAGQIAEAVWPEHAPEAEAVTDDMIEEVVERLRGVIEEPGAEFQHIEHVPGAGYRFLNCPA